MSKVKNDSKLVSFCGLYCGSCGKFKKGKCPGCAGNEKASWCKIRKCNLQHDYKSCADCTEHKDVMECKLFNNFMGKVFAFIFKSDREAGIKMIKEKGYEGFADYMAEKGLVAIKK